VRSHPEDRGGLAEACRAFLDVRRFDKAVWLAKQILRPLRVQGNGRSPIPEFWRCLYPQAHWALVREEAAREGLDPFLVTALMREESAFAPRAVSSAGAQGLMQLMPQTAARMEVTDPFDPRQNILGGTRLLRVLANRFGGDLVRTIAGYHAGAGAVDRYRGVPPYETTHVYLKMVLKEFYDQKAKEARAAAVTREQPRALNP